MKCKKCGRNLKPGIKYCLECGNYNKDEFDEIEEDEDDDDNENEEYEEFEEQLDFDEEVYDELVFEEDEDSNKKDKKSNKKKKVEEDDDEIEVEDSSITSKLVDAYIGEDYKKIRKPMNIFALLLSWIYYLYRKMYVIGTLGLILTGIVIKKYYDYIIIYAIVVMLLSSIIFNPVYLLVAKIRVTFLKKKNLTFKEQRELCEQKGGVNLIVPLLFFAVFLGIMIATSAKVVETNKDKYFEKNSENQANCKVMAKQAYKILEDNDLTKDVIGIACNITIKTTKKSYNIYFKVKDDLNEEYLYFENKDNKLILKGNTKQIDELEEIKETRQLSDDEKNILETSRNIGNKYKKVTEDSDYEKRLIETRTNNKERTNYTFNKNDITD